MPLHRVDVPAILDDGGGRPWSTISKGWGEWLGSRTYSVALV